MGKVKTCLFYATFSFFFLTSAFGDTILLKSGQKVEGKIIENTGECVKIDFLGVELTYYKDEIASVSNSDSSVVKDADMQMESLYKAYVSSRNIPVAPKEEQGSQPSLPALPEAKEDVKSVSASAPAPSLSQLPPGYQAMIQDIMKGLQSGQANQPAGMPSGVDISKLPPEYQQMLKTSLSGLQASGPGSTEKKQ